MFKNFKNFRSTLLTIYYPATIVSIFFIKLLFYLLIKLHTFFLFAGNECNPDTCVGLSSGTATFTKDEEEETDQSYCTCQCHQHLPAFREDLQICVDDIHGMKLINQQFNFLQGGSSRPDLFIT